MYAPSRTDRILSLWRSLWIQASWSFKGMQTVGFVHALEPLIKGDEEVRRRKLLSHLDFFNAHPFLAPMALGAVAAAEAEGAEPSIEAGEARRLMMGPLGGLGDSLFWGGLKPLVVLLALLLCAEGFFWAPWAMVGIFIVVNIGARWYALDMGLSRGKLALLDIQKYRPVLAAAKFKLAAAAVAGWIVVRLAWTQETPIPLSPLASAVSAVVAALAVAWAVRRETDPLLIIYAAAVTALFIGMAK